MEIRRVQMTGGSSFIITLPKEWIKSHHINKNDPIGLVYQPDGTLMVTPNITGEQMKREKKIDIDKIDDPEFLFRLLVGAYIMGYSSIELRSKTRFPIEARNTLRRFVQSAIGPEIVEESDKSIQIKDLLNPVEMPFDKSIRRMHTLVRTMHQDAITSVITSDKELADAVISRDVEVDRLNWLIEHQYNIVSREANLVGKMGITPDEAQFYFLVSRVMERIGDHAVRIASNYTALEEGKASIYEESIRDASETALGVFNDSTSAWFQKDMVLANKAVQSVNNVTKKCRKISEVMSKERPASSIKRLPVAYVRESIRRTGEYSADIGELVINHLV